MAQQEEAKIAAPVEENGVDPDLLEDLDAALAAGESADSGTPADDGSIPSSGDEETVTLRLPGESVELNLAKSLGQRMGTPPDLSLSEEAESLILAADVVEYPIRLSFTVTPEGFIRDLNILSSPGITTVDQELKRKIGLGLKFLAEPDAEDGEAVMTIVIKVN